MNLAAKITYIRPFQFRLVEHKFKRGVMRVKNSLASRAADFNPRLFGFGTVEFAYGVCGAGLNAMYFSASSFVTREA
jgi:hypothetical protein